VGTGSPRLLLIFTAAVGLAVVVTAALALESWVATVGALVVVFAAAAVLHVSISRRLSQGSKPDPVDEARREAMGAEAGERDQGGSEGDEDEPKMAW
jgi:membrane protein implicated in regulation of membrane protease activity